MSAETNRLPVWNTLVEHFLFFFSPLYILDGVYTSAADMHHLQYHHSLPFHGNDEKMKSVILFTAPIVSPHTQAQQFSKRV